MGGEAGASKQRVRSRTWESQKQAFNEHPKERAVQVPLGSSRQEDDGALDEHKLVVLTPRSGGRFLLSVVFWGGAPPRLLVKT